MIAMTMSLRKVQKNGSSYVTVNAAALMLETHGQEECSQWAQTANYMEEVRKLCCELLKLQARV